MVFNLSTKAHVLGTIGNPSVQIALKACCPNSFRIRILKCVCWEVSRIVRGYRYRWTGTETFHRDGKQQLGMGDCQLRDGEGHTRHRHLVMLAYSLLMRQWRQGQAYDWAYAKLNTIGEAGRAMLRETLRKTLGWTMERKNKPDWTRERVMAHLRLL